jgi:DNA-binding MarR family transcriptional regulator
MTDLMRDLGPLALGSRLKRLSDRMMKDVSRVYSANGVDFEPRWFPVYYLLIRSGNSVSVGELSRQTGFTHPAIVQILKDMSRKGIVNSCEGVEDRRQRFVSLSDRGKRMAPALERIWDDIRTAAADIAQASGVDLLAVISRMERALEERGVHERVTDLSKQRHLREVKIHDYRPAFRDLFRALNEEWLNKYFKLEPHDIEVLNDPDTFIIQPGGTILFAELDGEIVGTCALAPTAEPGVLELAKMAVTERAQGKQIGKKLGLAIIEQARKRDARALILESNSKLETAINLYLKLGFKHTPRPAPSDYERSDVYMRLDFLG